MTTILFTFVFFLLMIGIMSVGVLMGRKPIAGSCGGLSAATREDCPICGGSPAKCEEESQRQLAYDAAASKD